MPGKAESGWQLYCFLLSGGFGFWLGTAYALCGMARAAAVHRLSRWGWDVGFCVTAAWMLFLFSLPLTGGRLRWYLLCGAAIGFFAGRETLGRLLCRTARRLHRLFCRAGQAAGKVLRGMGRVLFRPVRKMAAGLQKVCRNAQKNSKKLLQLPRLMVYNQHKGRMG